AMALDRAPQIFRRKPRPPVCLFHHKPPRHAEKLVAYEMGRAERKARVSGSRLNVNLLEGRAVEDLAVRQAVECDAPGEAQRTLPRETMKGVQVRKKNFFERGLHACGNVVMPLFER